jgi:hypothetical protein
LHAAQPGSPASQATFIHRPEGRGFHGDIPALPFASHMLGVESRGAGYDFNLNAEL